MAIALDGVVSLTGPDGERELPVGALYQDDGIVYMAKQPAEVVSTQPRRKRARTTGYQFVPR